MKMTIIKGVTFTGDLPDLNGYIRLIEEIAGIVTNVSDTVLPDPESYSITTRDGDTFYLTSRFRVISITNSTGALNVIAGLNGTNGNVDGTGTAARFGTTRQSALSPDGATLWVADPTHGRLVRITLSTGATVSTLTGLTAITGVYATTTHVYFTRGDANLYRWPIAGGAVETVGTVAGAGLMYIAPAPDRNSLIVTSNNFVTTTAVHGVYEFNLGTSTFALRAGSVTAGHVNGVGGAAQFNRPWGVTVGYKGKYAYITDFASHYVRRLDLDDGTVTDVAGNGTGATTNGTGTGASLNTPLGIVIWGEALYVGQAITGASQTRTRKIT